MDTLTAFYTRRSDGNYQLVAYIPTYLDKAADFLEQLKVQHPDHKVIENVMSDSDAPEILEPQLPQLAPA